MGMKAIQNLPMSKYSRDWMLDESSFNDILRTKPRRSLDLDSSAAEEVYSFYSYFYP